MTRLVTLMMIVGAVLALPFAGAQDEGPLQAQWQLVVEHAQFGPRDTAEPFIFDGKMWLSNGFWNGNVLYPDLWVAEPGAVNWRCVLEKTPYWPYAEMVVYEGSIYAIKGDVWVSTDGEHWERILEETPFGVLGYGEVLVHDGRIWQIGGRDIWNTADEFRYVLGNILRSTRYGAISSRIGKVQNVLVGVILSDCEVFSNLELTQSVYDRLRGEAAEPDFPLRVGIVVEAIRAASDELAGRVVGQLAILPADEITALVNEITAHYADEKAVKEMLENATRMYGPQG